MAQQFKGILTPNDLISIPKFRAYIRLMIDGVMSDPFSMSTIPLGQPEASEEIKEKIRAQSRQRYAMERGKLEELIKVWSNKTFSPVEKAMEKALAQDAAAPIPVAASTSVPVSATIPKPTSSAPVVVAPSTPPISVPVVAQVAPEDVSPVVNSV